MKIYIKEQDFGFWSEKPVTVQRVEKYTDEDEPYTDVVWCNHDGSWIDEYENVEYCDKCSAHRFNRNGLTEEWQDTPEWGQR